MSGDRLNRLPLYLSAASECAYLPGRQSRSLFVDPEATMDMRVYSQLARQGFRRSGRLVYRPQCDDCRECLAVRLPVQRFVMKRRFRRVLKMNHGATVKARSAAFLPEHYALYRRYTASRHAGGSMQDLSPDEYADFLMVDWCDTQFVEIRQHDRLLGVAVTDQLQDGLSAVYTFFDPDLGRLSLGTFAILVQVDLCRRLGLPYLYLGYWIRDSAKMSYKADFRPLQIFTEGQWTEFGPGETIITT